MMIKSWILIKSRMTWPLVGQTEDNIWARRIGNKLRRFEDTIIQIFSYCWSVGAIRWQGGSGHWHHPLARGYTEGFQRGFEPLHISGHSPPSLREHTPNNTTEMDLIFTVFVCQFVWYHRVNPHSSKNVWVILRSDCQGNCLCPWCSGYSFWSRCTRIDMPGACLVHNDI